MVFTFNLFRNGLLVFMSIFLSHIANAQYINLTGKVTDAQTSAPLVHAEVYLTNTTIRAVTDSTGRYIIKNIPAGTYELIAWCAGCETKPMVLVAAVKEQTLNISLKARIIQLAEVTITDISERKRNLERFKKEFIGRSEEAEECRILNEEILDLKYSSKTQILTAKTDDFLEVINPSLGYKLRFLIKDLYVNYKDLIYHYSGSMIFEEMPGTKKDEKRWAKNRNETYEGSFRHFITSVTDGRVKKNGFVVKELTRVPNPGRPADSLIIYKLTKQFTFKYKNKSNNDSLTKWSNFNKMPRLIQTLSKEEVPESAIIKPGELPQTYDLQFPGILYVIYKHKYVEMTRSLFGNNENLLYRFKEAGNHQIAAVNMQTPGQPITFNDSGIQLSTGQFFYDGTWGDSRLSKQLPFDFIPDKQ